MSIIFSRTQFSAHTLFSGPGIYIFFHQSRAANESYEIKMSTVNTQHSVPVFTIDFSRFMLSEEINSAGQQVPTYQE